MKEITQNEMNFILTLFKSPEIEYNTSSLARKIGLSPMGALKIARQLEKEDIISSKELGKAKFYSLNTRNEYVRQYLKFLLNREAEQAHPYIRRWIDEIRKIRHAGMAVLYGSVLRKHNEAGDIDVLLIVTKKQFPVVKEELQELNRLNIKQLHPMYQGKGDFIKNIKKGDKPLLNAIKGIVIFGEDIMIGLLDK